MENPYCREASSGEKSNRPEDLIKICAGCRRVCDDNGSWQHDATASSVDSAPQLSHALCPDCARKLYPDYYHGGCIGRPGPANR